MSEKKYSIISLGAGVQSSAMALMAALGEIKPMPDAAIFADTGAELPNTYEWLDWLDVQLPFPIHIVSAGDLATETTKNRTSKTGTKYMKYNIPSYTLDTDGKKGQTQRQCTYDFKVIPIRKKLRALCGINRGEKTHRVTQWMGISADEMSRMRISQEPWLVNRYPLIEMNLTRQDCLDWMKAHGFPKPSRSACYFCPFHDNAEWRRIKNEYPEYFQLAIDLERTYSKAKEHYGIRAFFHPSRVPLDWVDFRNDVEKGQPTLWEIECEGMCGI